MKNTWIKILLIFSLSLNLAVLGALGYSVAKQYRDNKMEPPSLAGIPPDELSPQILRSRTDFKERVQQQRSIMQQERNKLAQLLMEEPPDVPKIQQRINSINAIQAKIQQSIADQILWETRHMTPEQRKIYLTNIQNRMGCKTCGTGKRHRHRSRGMGSKRGPTSR